MKQTATNTIEASKLETGMVYWDGCKIEVVSSTKAFVNVLLHSDTLSVERKIKKTSIVWLA